MKLIHDPENKIVVIWRVSRQREAHRKLVNDQEIDFNEILDFKLRIRRKMLTFKVSLFCNSSVIWRTKSLTNQPPRRHLTSFTFINEMRAIVSNEPEIDFLSNHNGHQRTSMIWQKMLTFKVKRIISVLRFIRDLENEIRLLVIVTDMRITIARKKIIILKKWIVLNNLYSTGKSLSEALLSAEHGENMLCTKIVLNVRNNFCTYIHVHPRFELGIFIYWTCNSMNNLSSYCWLVDAKIRASDKDLPVNKMKNLTKKREYINEKKIISYFT